MAQVWLKGKHNYILSVKPFLVYSQVISVGGVSAH